MSEYYSAVELEEITGTPAATWRYWAYVDEGKDDEDRVGPRSMKIGRRRVWKKTIAHAWLDSLESASA